ITPARSLPPPHSPERRRGVDHVRLAGREVQAIVLPGRVRESTASTNPAGTVASGARCVPYRSRHRASGARCVP
ncbi:MAG TPA: hypothetical protein VEX41_07695, partial [Candidatus Eisenbacteria bacterium]|nr:hypothetical protein [Candidatus Eisenbacteria bacterium]